MIFYLDESGQEWWKEVPWEGLFNSLTSKAANPATNTLRIFSKFSKLKLIGEAEAEFLYLPCDATPVTPFMAMPKMSSIVYCMVCGRNLRWPYGTGKSEITSFNFEGCP